MCSCVVNWRWMSNWFTLDFAIWLERGSVWSARTTSCPQLDNKVMQISHFKMFRSIIFLWSFYRMLSDVFENDGLENIFLNFLFHFFNYIGKFFFRFWVEINDVLSRCVICILVFVIANHFRTWLWAGMEVKYSRIS